MYEDGFAPAEIAGALGVTASAVRLRRRAEGWTGPGDDSPSGATRQKSDSAAPLPQPPETVADTMRKAASLLAGSVSRAARQGEAGRAAAEAEKLARLEKLIEETGRREDRREQTGETALPAAEAKALREALERDLNLALRAWVRESLRAMLRHDLMQADSREALAAALQKRIDRLGEPTADPGAAGANARDGAPPDFAGWPIRIGDVQRMGAGFWNNYYAAPDPALARRLEKAASGRDPNRLLFGLIDGQCFLHPWQRAPE